MGNREPDGPNVLWLTEALVQSMDLGPGMRVLDMGCGKALSSIFLAKEFCLQVWAADLWIRAEENWERVSERSLQNRVFSIHAEAHALPFADEFFDVLVSLDAYHYFGTDDLYLSYYTRFLRKGGQLGIVVSGLQRELTTGLPDHLKAYWENEYWSFQSHDWQRRHWEKTGRVRVDLADTIPDGWEYWLKWLDICREEGAPTYAREAEMLRADPGQNLGFTRVVARKT